MRRAEIPGNNQGEKMNKKVSDAELEGLSVGMLPDNQVASNMIESMAQELRLSRKMVEAFLGVKEAIQDIQMWCLARQQAPNILQLPDGRFISVDRLLEQIQSALDKMEDS